MKHDYDDSTDLIYYSDAMNALFEAMDDIKGQMSADYAEGFAAGISYAMSVLKNNVEKYSSEELADAEI